MNGLQIVTAKEASAILKGQHYLGPVEYSPRFCIANDDRTAVAVFSYPVSHHFKRELHEPLELARLWQADQVKTPLSQFLGAALRWVRKLAPEADCIFSYADPSRKNFKTGKNHIGIIYQACNFTYLGESRVTDVWKKPNGDTVSSPVCYRLFKTKSRERIKELNPAWRLMRAEPKHLYIFGLKRKPDEIIKAIQGRYKSKQAFPRLRGPGRPKGRAPVITLALPRDLLARIDARATERSETRASLLRALIERGLGQNVRFRR